LFAGRDTLIGKRRKTIRQAFPRCCAIIGQRILLLPTNSGLWRPSLHKQGDHAGVVMGKGDRIYKPPSENELAAILHAFEEKYRQSKTDADRAAAARSAHLMAQRHGLPVPDWAKAEIDAIVARGFTVRHRRGERGQRDKADIEKRNLLCMMWLHELRTSLRMTICDAAIVVERAFSHYNDEARSQMPYMASAQLAQMYSRDKWAERLKGWGQTFLGRGRDVPLPSDLLTFVPESLGKKYPIIGILSANSKGQFRPKCQPKFKPLPESAIENNISPAHQWLMLAREAQRYLTGNCCYDPAYVDVRRADYEEALKETMLNRELLLRFLDCARCLLSPQGMRHTPETLT